MTTNMIAFTFYVLYAMSMFVQVTWSQDINGIGSDTCSDRTWREDMKRQLDATQKLLQQYAMKIMELEKKINIPSKNMHDNIQSTSLKIMMLIEFGWWGFKSLYFIISILLRIIFPISTIVKTSPGLALLPLALHAISSIAKLASLSYWSCWIAIKRYNFARSYTKSCSKSSNITHFVTQYIYSFVDSTNKNM